jgi:hypothetical protein
VGARGLCIPPSPLISMTLLLPGGSSCSRRLTCRLRIHLLQHLSTPSTCTAAGRLTGRQAGLQQLNTGL